MVYGFFFIEKDYVIINNNEYIIYNFVYLNVIGRVRIFGLMFFFSKFIRVL